MSVLYQEMLRIATVSIKINRKPEKNSLNFHDFMTNSRIFQEQKTGTLYSIIIQSKKIYKTDVLD